MKLSRRQLLHLAAGATALPAVSRIAAAQAYPSRPVRIIVPFAPGGATDIIARLMGQWLSERLGQQFITENRPGAGSNVGTEVVVNAPPDGYTLLQVGASSAINMTLYEKLNFNFLRDITPVAGIISIPFIMAVNLSVPAKTVPEFIAYAEMNPSKVNMGSGGNGTAGHLSGELFKMMARVNMVHVPYRGEAPALTDLLGGQVQVMFGTVPASIEYIRAGKLRALAVTSARRSEVLPDSNFEIVGPYLAASAGAALEIHASTRTIDFGPSACLGGHHDHRLPCPLLDGLLVRHRHGQANDGWHWRVGARHRRDVCDGVLAGGRA
jgi:tripartite-type tricarboxylate transporter receptor subunit TctC